MAKIVFWSSFAWIFYVYCGYPILLLLSRRVQRRTAQKMSAEPHVSLIIAVYNERECIEDKLQNCLALDYPSDKLEIVVSVDGSTDGTAALARRYESQRVSVLESAGHQGKASALNSAVAASRGDVIVFADARQELSPNAVREIVSDLQDPSVGAVSGELILRDRISPAGQARDPVGLYWRYEKWIRSMESEANSVVGTSGALYGIRRESFVPLPENTLLDDVWLPMRIALNGKRVVFEPSARAYDNVSCCPEMEFGRKVRTLLGNYQLLFQMPELLLPWKNPLFIQFVSHKVGRLLVPYFMAALFIANCFLLHGFYLFFLALQVLWYGMALGGLFAARGRSVDATSKPYISQQQLGGNR